MKPKCSMKALGCILASLLAIPALAAESTSPDEVAYAAIKAPLQAKVDEGALAPESMERFVNALLANRDSLAESLDAGDSPKDLEANVLGLMTEAGLRLRDDEAKEITWAALEWADLAVQQELEPVTLPEPIVPAVVLPSNRSFTR